MRRNRGPRVCAGRRDAASSVASVALLRTLPAFLPPTPPAHPVGVAPPHLEPSRSLRIPGRVATHRLPTPSPCSRTGTGEPGEAPLVARALRRRASPPGLTVPNTIRPGEGIAEEPIESPVNRRPGVAGKRQTRRWVERDERAKRYPSPAQFPLAAYFVHWQPTEALEGPGGFG